MKNLIFLFAFTLISNLATAQLHSYNSTIDESSEIMSQGSNNAFTLELPGVGKDMAEDIWKKYSKNYDGKTKKDRKSKEFFTDDAEIRDMSSNPVDIYASFSNVDTTTTAQFWFDLGGAYLSSELHADKVGAAQSLLNAYAFEVGKEKAKEGLKYQEKGLKELEKDMSKLQKNNKEYHKRVEEAKKLIAEMERNIEVNVKNQEAKQTEIDGQKVIVEKAASLLSKFN